MADIEIKRGYEVLPDNKVRFGVRVINNGDFAISEVEIILDYNPSLFELEGSGIERLGNVPPLAPRTAKFTLKPLSCVHKEEIGATVRYRDHKWVKHTVDMRPKEIHCVCPFLKEKSITRSNFLKLSNEGYSAEYGLNFENISPEKLVEFLSHTCKNRLYKVDEFSIENRKILYLAGEALGEKAYYLLTAIVIEKEKIVQVLLHASSDKSFGIHGFLNEIIENLRHLVRSVNSAREIGIIKNEQVINIINSVVQHTDFSERNDLSLVNIQDSVVQRTNFGSFEDQNRKKEAEEKLRRQQEEETLLKKDEYERLLRQKEIEEQEKLRKQREKAAKNIEKLKRKDQEEADRRKKDQERLQQEEQERKSREEVEKFKKEWEEQRKIGKQQEEQELKRKEEAERKARDELERKKVEEASKTQAAEQNTKSFTQQTVSPKRLPSSSSVVKLNNPSIKRLISFRILFVLTMVIGIFGTVLLSYLITNLIIPYFNHPFLICILVIFTAAVPMNEFIRSMLDKIAAERKALEDLER